MITGIWQVRVRPHNDSPDLVVIERAAYTGESSVWPAEPFDDEVCRLSDLSVRLPVWLAKL